MSPRTEAQFEQIRNQKKALIMESAMELFAKKGYESTSISQIAKAAGISKGLMYNYFENKEELLRAIMDVGIDDLINLFDANKDGILEPEEMQYFIEESCRHLKEHQNYWRLYFQVMMQEKGFEQVNQRIQEIYRPLMVILIRYFKNAGFENPEMESMLFGSLMDGISINYVLNPNITPLDTIKDELIKRYCKKIK